MSYSGWKIADVQYLHHKAVTSIALEREDGKRLYVNVSDEAFEKHHTVYFSSNQAKESPQGIDSDDESIVGAGTDFLMKVTEEAVISGMILAGESPATVRDSTRRSHYRGVAEMITLEEVKRYVEFDQQDDSPFTFRPREEDPACESDDSVIRAAHGVPAPHGFEKVGPPRILPADRYAPGAVTHLDPSEEFQKWAEEEHEKYLDATQGK